MLLGRKFTRATYHNPAIFSCHRMQQWNNSWFNHWRRREYRRDGVRCDWWHWHLSTHSYLSCPVWRQSSSASDRLETLSRARHTFVRRLVQLVWLAIELLLLLVYTAPILCRPFASHRLASPSHQDSRSLLSSTWLTRLASLTNTRVVWTYLQTSLSSCGTVKLLSCCLNVLFDKSSRFTATFRPNCTCGRTLK